MEHGGCREGSGRKQGISNLLTHELREKIDAALLIGFLQKLAAGKIEGSTISERKDAAIALLRKVLPDCRLQEMKNETPIIIKLSEADMKL